MNEHRWRNNRRYIVDRELNRARRDEETGQTADPEALGEEILRLAEENKELHRQLAFHMTDSARAKAQVQALRADIRSRDQLGGSRRTDE